MLKRTDTLIFPWYCVIGNSRELLRREGLKGIPCHDHVLFNRHNGNVYTIDRKLRTFLEWMRRPKSFEQIKQVYEAEDLKDQIITLVKAKVLVPEDRFYKPEKDAFRPKIGKYTLISVMKETEFLFVAQAEDRKGNKYAIKYLKPGQRQSKRINFDQEFRIYRLLGDHPLIPKLIEYDKQKRYGVLEFVEGQGLNWLVSSGQLSLDEKIHIAGKALEVLSYVHTCNVTHGDVHGSQFIVNEKRELKLLDFGYGYYHGEDAEPYFVIRGALPIFCDPEAMANHAFKNFSDYTPSFSGEVYRIGVLLYHLFFEKFPFDPVTWRHFNDLTRNVAPQFPATTPKGEAVPGHIITIMERCLHKAPGERYASACELREAFLHPCEPGSQDAERAARPEADCRTAEGRPFL